MSTTAHTANLERTTMADTTRCIAIGTTFPAGYPNYGYTWQVTKAGPRQATCVLVRPDGTHTAQRMNITAAQAAEAVTPEYAQRIARDAELDGKVSARIAADSQPGGVLHQDDSEPTAELTAELDRASDDVAGSLHAELVRQADSAEWQRTTAEREAELTTAAWRHQDSLVDLEADLAAAEDATAERWQQQLQLIDTTTRRVVAAGRYGLPALNLAVAQLRSQRQLTGTAWAPYPVDLDPLHNVGRGCVVRPGLLPAGMLPWTRCYVRRYLGAWPTASGRLEHRYMVDAAQPVMAAQHPDFDPSTLAERLLGWSVHQAIVSLDSMDQLY